VVGNGNVLVGYDANYSIRDLFFPHVGLENQTVGNLCRTGFFVDGRFAWLEDPAWERRLAYWQDTLVTDVTLTHPGLGITVHFEDFVDMVRDYLIRKVRITTVNPVANLRAFFHHDWYMRESDLGTTVLYEPEHRAVIAYKGDRWALAGGICGDQFGISSWATGKKGTGLAGTWVDAEDGELGRNPIDQGSVDSTIAFHLGALGAGESREFTHWVVFGKNLAEVTTFGQDLICTRDPDTYLVRTRTYWDRWSDKDHGHIEQALGINLRHLYRRSVLTVRTQVDNRGGIVAANDYDITKFARDTYSYVWPRDGALVANSLDRAGHEDITRQFFTFCQRVVGPEGYFLHKYAPDGQPGSSWHPWIDASGAKVLPIQEDETGLVIWALWEHYRIHRNLDFAMGLYSTLVVPAATWMASYVDPRNGLVKPSWDLWEERWGVHAFTVGAVWGGLQAAAKFADLYGDAGSQELFSRAAASLRTASDAHLFQPSLGRFVRRLTIDPDGSPQADSVLDSAIYGLWRFGMYPADDPRIVQTMEAIRDQLSNQAACGGQARYTNDYYFQVDHDVARVPGNPWFICTLWLAQWYIATANSLDDLARARQLVDWVEAHRTEAGMLSEQVDPNTGAPLSVAPLTWSHAELVVTVDDYVRRVEWLRHNHRTPEHPPLVTAGD